jgi:hypothetical protein
LAALDERELRFGLKPEGTAVDEFRKLAAAAWIVRIAQPHRAIE